MAYSTWPARHWVSARSVGVGPLVGRRPARWVSARSLGVGPLVGRRPACWASARSLGCRSARWAAARSLGRRPSICHSPRVGAPVCDIILPPPPPPPPPPPNRVDVIRPGVGGNSPVHAVERRFINVCWGIGRCRGSHNPPATPSGGIYQQSFREASSTPFPPNCGVGIRRNVRVIA